MVVLGWGFFCMTRGKSKLKTPLIYIFSNVFVISKEPLVMLNTHRIIINSAALRSSVSLFKLIVLCVRHIYCLVQSQYPKGSSMLQTKTGGEM